MDAQHSESGPDTTGERQRRVAWEAHAIAEARATRDSGMYVASADMNVWIDSIGTDHETPPHKHATT